MFRALVSTSTILPSLLLSSVANIQIAAASPVGSPPIVIAQATTPASEEETRRRLEAEKLRQHPPAAPPAAVAPHPVAPLPAPVQHVAPPPPPVQNHTPPQPIVVPHPVAPPPVVPNQAHTPPVPGQPAIVPQHPVAQVPPNNGAPVRPIAPPPPVPVAPAPVAPNPIHTPPAGVPVHPPVAPVNPQINPQVHSVPLQPGHPQPVAPNAVNQPSTLAPHFPPQPQQQPGNPPKRNGITPLEAGAIGVAAGVVGGMIIGQQAHGLQDVQTSRRTVEQNGATFYSEPGRVIVREGGGLYVRHDETERFREFGGNVRVEQHGDETIQTVDRPDGSKIITITDADGQMLKRVRRLPNGSEFVLIDNSFRPRPRHFADETIVLPPPPMTLAPDQYEVDAGTADETQIYDALSAPPLAALPRRYTLDEVRNSRDVRQYMRSVDINTITFSTGSWTIEDSEVGRLQAMADAINQAIRANPNEIFLVEGYTDAVGSDVDNLSLSDRRAQTVAAILTRTFNVPPENLTTQGYGSQFLKVPTDGPARENRRVTVRRVTPLLANGTQH